MNAVTPGGRETSPCARFEDEFEEEDEDDAGSESDLTFLREEEEE